MEFCRADIDGDGRVNVNDLIQLLTEWDLTGPGLAADVDQSGLVDVNDLILVISQWGDC